MSASDEVRKKESKLEWKDYIAITIASLQTVLLPIVLLLIALFAFAILLGIFLGR